MGMIDDAADTTEVFVWARAQPASAILILLPDPSRHRTSSRPGYTPRTTQDRSPA
jgi:hypothetical protein